MEIHLYLNEHQRYALMASQLAENIGKNLQIDEDLIENLEDEQVILDLVMRWVQEIMDSNMERLFYVLYRLDISEIKIKHALDINGPNNAALEIAKLILEREKEKIETRKADAKHSEDTSDWIF